ncbi:MAG: hypothetical protein NTW19_12405 [Planctomycetota bacterium]|nr:hypothetical protein [Planctomycetota bacterium]
MNPHACARLPFAKSAAAIALALAALGPLAPAHAEEAAAPASQPAAALKGDFLLLAEQTSMTAEQRAKLAETLHERETAIQAFNAQNEAKIRQLQKEMLAARETHNRESMLMLGKQHQSLEAARRDVADKYDKRIVGLMTKEQAQTWEGYKLSRALLRDLGKVNLSAEQGAAIRSRSEKTAAALVGTDDQSRNKIRAELRKSIESDVLTQAQRDELQKSVERRPAETPAGGAPTKPAAPDNPASSAPSPAKSN